MHAGAVRELQQYAPAGTCQTHNVVPINRGASSSSLDLQERVKRSNVGGDNFEIEVSVTQFSNFWTFSRREAFLGSLSSACRSEGGQGGRKGSENMSVYPRRCFVNETKEPSHLPAVQKVGPGGQMRASLMGFAESAENVLFACVDETPASDLAVHEKIAILERCLTVLWPTSELAETETSFQTCRLLDALYYGF